MLQKVTERETPFRREPLPIEPGNSFVRLITAKAIASATRTTVADVAERLWPSDKLILRATSAPAMTATSGWAQELAHRVVMDALAALGPASAGAQVLAKGLVLNFGNAGSISAPGFIAGAGNASFVAEGAPIPVRQLSSTAVILTPFKIAAISVLTREMVEGSNAEALIADTLIRSAGNALDAALFDSSASSTARPAGLRNGISTTSASNSTDLYEAVFEDITNLINACAPIGGNGPYVIISSPGRTLMMQSRFSDAVTGITYLGSAAVGNDLLCIATNALVSALSADPAVDTARAAALQMNDAPATNFDSAAPAKSMWQTDSMAIKMRWPVTWMLRNAGGLAWTTPTWK